MGSGGASLGLFGALSNCCQASLGHRLAQSAFCQSPLESHARRYICRD